MLERARSALSRERTLELWEWCITSRECSVRLDKGRKSESSQNEILLYFFFNCEQFVAGEQTLLEEHIASSLNKLCSDVHRTTFQVIFAPISVQLEQVQSAPAWSSVNKQATNVAADLPDFSFAPQEYITQVSWKVVTYYSLVGKTGKIHRVRKRLYPFFYFFS